MMAKSVMRFEFEPCSVAASNASSHGREKNILGYNYIKIYIIKF